MPSRSEGWGGLFNDEQYRLIRSALRAFIRAVSSFEQTTPPVRGSPPYKGLALSGGCYLELAFRGITRALVTSMVMRSVPTANAPAYVLRVSRIRSATDGGGVVGSTLRMM
jgi:hypothetical protein